MRVEHLMYVDDFKLLRGRLSVVQEKDLDPHIVPFLIAANSSDELVTVWSCEGHRGSRRWNKGYVILGVRDRDHMYKLYDLVRQEFGESQHLVSLNMTTRLNFVKGKNPKTGMYGWFAVWILNWKHDKNVSREKGWEHLEAAGVKFIEWLKGQRLMT